MYKLIMSADLNWNIGKDGDLLYKTKRDMQNFKMATTGQTLIMGRKTFDSLGGALPSRLHLVLISKTDRKNTDSVKYFNSVKEIKTYVEENELNPWIIGGAQIIDLFLEDIDFALITRFQEVRDDANTQMYGIGEDERWQMSYYSDYITERFHHGLITYRFEVYVIR
jgi:dihydrofolate reductase